MQGRDGSRSLGFRCFECAKPAQFSHHVIPYVLGGTRTIPLCEQCHRKVHHKSFMEHANLIKVGLQKAKERGVRLGRPWKPAPEGLYRLPGETERALSKRLGYPRTTLQRWIKDGRVPMVEGPTNAS